MNHINFVQFNPFIVSNSSMEHLSTKQTKLTVSIFNCFYHFKCELFNALESEHVVGMTSFEKGFLRCFAYDGVLC